ncbi:hypothetical protein PG987_005538 [Apiospora arundinis]
MPAPVEGEGDNSFFTTYKYKLSAGTYLGIITLLCYRVHRKPHAPIIKRGQYETIFKGTGLSAVVGGMLMSSEGAEKIHDVS